MEMDFRSMKRKELQAHCKKHGLPANLTNSQMAESLESLLLSQEKVKPKGCLKGSGGSGGASKKVSFTLDEEEKLDLDRNSGRRKRRSSVAVAEEVVPESDVPARPRTRSLAKAVVWSPVVGKKARRSTGGVRANDESIPVINLSSDDEKMEEENVPATRALRSRVVAVGVGEEVKMAEKKAAVEVMPTRSLRDRVVSFGEGEGAKREKKTAGEVPATRASRSRAVVAGKGEEIQNEKDDATMEKQPAEKVPVTRSLRSKAVAESEGEKTQMDMEPRHTRKRARAVEGPGDEKVPEVNLNIDDEPDARKAEKKSEAPAARSLRNRTVVVGGDKALVGDIEPRKTRRSQKAAKGAEAGETKPGESEGAEKKDLETQRDDAVSAVLVSSVDESQKDAPPKEAPVRRTRRMLSKPESSQSEVEMHGIVEAITDMDGGNVGDKGITVQRRKTRKLGSESPTEVVPPQALTELPRKSTRGSRRNEPVSDELVMDDKAVNDKKVGRRTRKTVEEKAEGETRKQPVTSKARKSSAPKSDSAMEMEEIEVHEGTRRAVNSDESQRKSSRNANDHNLVLVEDGKPEDGDLAAGENKFSPRPRGARRQRIVRKAKEIPTPENETAKDPEAVDVQDDTQKVVLNEDSPRRSEQNAPGLNVPVPLDRKPDDVDMILGEAKCVEVSPKLNERSNLKRKHENSNVEVGDCAYLFEKVTEVQQPMLTDDFSGSPSQNDQLKRSGSGKSPVLSMRTDDASLASPFCGKRSGNVEIAQSHIEASVLKAVERVLEVTCHENSNVEVDVLPGRMNEAASEGIMDADKISNLQYTTLEQEDGVRTMPEILNAESTQSRSVQDIEEVAQETKHEDVTVSANSGAKEVALNISSSSPIPTSCQQDETYGLLAVHEARGIIDLSLSLSHSDEFSPSRMKKATQDIDHELVTAPVNSSVLPHQTSSPLGHEERFVISVPVSSSHSNELSSSEFQESAKETNNELVAAHANSSGFPIQTSCHQDKTDVHLAGHETTNTISIPLSFSLNDELSPSDIKEASQEPDLEFVIAPANSSGLPIQMSFLQDKTDGLLTGQETTNFIGLPLSFTNSEVLSPSDVKDATQEIDFEHVTALANSSGSPIPTSCNQDETNGLLVDVSCNSDFAEVSFKKEAEITLTHANLLSEGKDEVEIGGTQNDEENTRGEISEPFQSVEGISNDAITHVTAQANSSGSPIPTSCNQDETDGLLVDESCNSDFAEVSFKKEAEITLTHVNLLSEGKDEVEIGGTQNDEENTRGDVSEPVQSSEGISNDAIFETGSGSYCNVNDSNILEMAEEDRGQSNLKFSDINVDNTEHVLTGMEREYVSELVEDFKGNSPSSDCIISVQEETKNSVQFPVSEPVHGISKVEMASLESLSCPDGDSDIGAGDQEAITLVVDNKHDTDMAPQVVSLEVVDAEPYKYVMNEATSEISEDNLIVVGSNNAEDFQDSKDKSPSHADCVRTPEPVVVLEVTEHYSKTSLESAGCSKFKSDVEEGVKHKPDNDLENQIATMEDVEVVPHKSTTDGGDSSFINTPHYDDDGINNPEVTNLTGALFSSLHAEDVSPLAYGEVASEKIADVTNENGSHGSSLSPINSVENLDDFTQGSANLRSDSIDEEQTCQETPHAIRGHVVSDVKESNTVGHSSHFSENLSGEPRECFVSPSLLFGTMNDDLGSDKGKDDEEGDHGETSLKDTVDDDLGSDKGKDDEEGDHGKTSLKDTVVCGPDHLASGSWCSPDHYKSTDATFEAQSVEHSAMIASAVTIDSPNLKTYSIELAESCQMPQIPLSVVDIAQDECNSEGTNCLDDDSLSEGASGASLAGLFSQDYNDNSSLPTANTPEELAKFQKSSCPQTDNQCTTSYIPICEQGGNTTVVCDTFGESNTVSDVKKLPDSAEKLSVVSKFSDPKGMTDESEGSIASNFKTNSRGLKCFDDSSLRVGDSGAAIARLFSEDSRDDYASPIANTPEVAKLRMGICPQADIRTPASIIAFREQRENITVYEASSENRSSCDVRKIPDSVEGLSVVSKLPGLKGMIVESGGSIKGNSERRSCLDDDSLSAGDSGDALAGLFCEDYKHPSASRFANTGQKCLDDDSLTKRDSGAALAGLFSEEYDHPSVSPIANTPEQVLDDDSLSAGDSGDALAGLFCEDYKHPSASRFANTGPECLDDDSLTKGDSGAALAGLFSEEYKHPSVSPIANTPKQVAKFQKFSCSQKDTQVPAAFSAQREHGENFTVVLDASTAHHNSSDARIVTDCTEELSVVEMGDKYPVNNNEQSTVSLEAKNDDNSGHSHDKSPYSLYGLNEGFPVEQLGDSVVRSSREVYLGLSSSQAKLEPSMAHGVLKENIVYNFDSPCYKSPKADTQLCEVGSSRLEVKHALIPADKDLKVSLDERPFSLSTLRENTAEYAEISLGMSSSQTKFEAFQVHDEHNEAQGDPFDPQSCSELHLALPVATDAQLCEVGSSRLRVKHALNIAEQDCNVSFNESPISSSIFKPSAADVEVTGSGIFINTTNSTRDFNFEYKTDRKQELSEEGIIDDSNRNVSTVDECESLGEKDDTNVMGDFIGEPVKDLCSLLTIKGSSDGVHITPPNVTDSEGFPGRENAMPFGNSFSAENLDFANGTDALLKDTDIFTSGSTALHRDSVDEAGMFQEMGVHEDVIGLKEQFSLEHKVSYSSSSFLFNEKATALNEESPMLNPDPESEMPTPQETPGSVMVVDGHSDVMTVEFLRKSESVSKETPDSVMVVDGHSDDMTVEFLTKSQSVSKYVLRTDEKVSEQSLIPEQKVEECEAVQETEAAFVDICTSQLYGSPLCRPFSESVDSRLNAVDLSLLQGTDERRVNDDDVLSSDESSFALNIFENEDSVDGGDSESLDHSQDSIWEGLQETASDAVGDEEIEKDYATEDKLVNDMKSTVASEEQANIQSEGIAVKIDMSMHTDELDRKDTCGTHLISSIVHNLGGQIHGAALTSSSLLQTPEQQGSSTSREITQFEDIASAGKPESGLGTSGLLFAELQNLEKSTDDGSAQSHKISSSPKNFSPLGYVRGSGMNISEMGDMSGNFTDKGDDEEVSVSLCDTSDQIFHADPEVSEKETKEIMDVESNLRSPEQGDEQKENEPFLVECDDKVTEAAVLFKTNDTLETTVASGCDMHDDDDQDSSDKNIDENLDEDYFCNDNEPDYENYIETSEANIFANAESARTGEEIAREGTDNCPIMPTVDCSPMPSKHDRDEIKGRSGPDTMDEINRRLNDFRITTARKFGRIQSTPLKQVKSLKFDSAIDMLKDKENMSVMKADRPPPSNIERSAKASSVRRPLQRVEKNNTAGQ